MPPNGFEALIRWVGTVRAAGLTPAEALLVIWNHDLLSAGPSACEAALAFAVSARAELAAVERALVPADDPDSALLSQLLSSVFGADTASSYLDFVERRARSEVAYAHSSATLPDAVLQAGDGLAYDDLLKRLAYTKGVMPPATLTALRNPALNQPQAFLDAVTALAAQSQVFFQELNQPALRQAHDAYLVSTAGAEVKRRDLLSAVIDALKPARRRQAVVERAVATLDEGPEWLVPPLSTPAMLWSAQGVALDATHDFHAVHRQRSYCVDCSTHPVAQVASGHDAAT